MSTSELTLTILGIAQIFGSTRHGEYWRGMFVSAVVRFALGTSLLLAFWSGVTEIFFVNLYIGYEVIYKCCLRTCKLGIVKWL